MKLQVSVAGVRMSNGVKENSRNGSGTYSASKLDVLLFLTTLLLAVCISHLLLLQNLKNETKSKTHTQPERSESEKPKIWIIGPDMHVGYLKHVFDVYRRLGYQTVDGSKEEWDVLWSHMYPFSKGYFNYLKPHQRVNHFPGTGFITNKVTLATSDLKHVPRAFHIPKAKDEFVQFAKENPNTLWVQKSNDHRGIKIKTPAEIDLNTFGTFVQEYIHNPLLVDGRKFDLGVYAILTSINPLRLYLYTNDILLRFCYSNYHPFNASNLESYVVDDHYTPIWEMPSLAPFFKDVNLNAKQTFIAYLRSQEKNFDYIWSQIEESIASAYIAKESQMLQLSVAFNTTRHFFELVRFDFLVDEDLNVYLMEANMSPNLSSQHFTQNQILYEQVLFAFLTLTSFQPGSDFRTWPEYPSDVWDMRIANRDLAVYDEHCASEECYKSCRNETCSVCLYCLDEKFVKVLKDAYLEHKSNWNCKRLIPTVTETSMVPQGSKNELQRTWFIGKCLQDPTWC